MQLAPRFAVAILLSLAANASIALPIPTATDFIAAGSRTNFVDFEAYGEQTNGLQVFIHDGVRVEQVNGDGDGILSTCRSACWWSNDTLSWYPNGGDHGWTEISRADGSDFVHMGLRVSNITPGGGGLSHYLMFEVLNDGASLLVGSAILPGGHDGFIGFTGGGFDVVRLLLPDFGCCGTSTFWTGELQALAIDDIELANVIPEPETYALLLAGLLLIGVRARKGWGQGKGTGSLP